MGNPWYFRFRPNDSLLGPSDRRLWRQIARQEEMGDRALYGHLRYQWHEGPGRMPSRAWASTPVLIQGYTNNSQDFTPVALALKRSGADVMASYITFETDLGILAKQLRQVGRDHSLGWFGNQYVHHRPSACGPGAQRHLRCCRLQSGIVPRRHRHTLTNMRPLTRDEARSLQRLGL